MANQRSFLNFGKPLLVLNIYAIFFILITSYVNVYQIKWMGIIFEILWLPTLLVILATPALSLFFWFRERFKLTSIFCYVFLLSLLSLILIKVLVKTH